MTPRFCSTVNIVRNCAEPALLVSAMNGAVFHDNSFSPADRRHQLKRLSEGTRNVGRAKLRFKDQCKTPTMEFSINVANWDMVAQDQVGRTAAVLMGANSYKENGV